MMSPYGCDSSHTYSTRRTLPLNTVVHSRSRDIGPSTSSNGTCQAVSSKAIASSNDFRRLPAAHQVLSSMHMVSASQLAPPSSHVLSGHKPSRHVPSSHVPAIRYNTASKQICPRAQSSHGITPKQIASPTAAQIPQIPSAQARYHEYADRSLPQTENTIRGGQICNSNSSRSSQLTISHANHIHSNRVPLDAAANRQSPAMMPTRTSARFVDEYSSNIGLLDNNGLQKFERFLSVIPPASPKGGMATTTETQVQNALKVVVDHNMLVPESRTEICRSESSSEIRRCGGSDRDGQWGTAVHVYDSKNALIVRNASNLSANNCTTTNGQKVLSPTTAVMNYNAPTARVVGADPCQIASQKVSGDTVRIEEYGNYQSYISIAVSQQGCSSTKYLEQDECLQADGSRGDGPRNVSLVGHRIVKAQGDDHHVLRSNTSDGNKVIEIVSTPEESPADIPPALSKYELMAEALPLADTPPIDAIEVPGLLSLLQHSRRSASPSAASAGAAGGVESISSSIASLTYCSTTDNLSNGHKAVSVVSCPTDASTVPESTAEGKQCPRPKVGKSRPKSVQKSPAFLKPTQSSTTKTSGQKLVHSRATSDKLGHAASTGTIRAGASSRVRSRSDSVDSKIDRNCPPLRRKPTATKKVVNSKSCEKVADCGESSKKVNRETGWKK
eukprot:Filipodium_phascolosomae@DN2696_c0_g1_i1.p1